MLELGTYSASEHAAVGEVAANMADELVLVGKDAQHTAEAALAAGMPRECVHLFACEVDDPNAIKQARDAAADVLRRHAREARELVQDLAPQQAFGQLADQGPGVGDEARTALRASAQRIQKAAAILIDEAGGGAQMESEGIISAADGQGKREVLVTA